MNWPMMTSTSASCHVGTLVPPMIRAVELADNFTAGDTVEATATATVVVTTSTAAPIDSVIRLAAHFAVTIVVPPRLPWRNRDHPIESSSARDIVASVRFGERSTQLLQSRPTSPWPPLRWADLVVHGCNDERAAAARRM
jgi:hypothetical protein